MAVAKSFDVWFLSANTVYRGVPLSVVADFTMSHGPTAINRLPLPGTIIDRSKNPSLRSAKSRPPCLAMLARRFGSSQTIFTDYIVYTI